MWLREGMRVELKGVEEGFLGSWFGVRILKLLKGGECTVQYEEFVDEKDESKPLQETVKISQLRPVPPTLNITSWLNKESVEVYHSNCWWVGFIQSYLTAKNKYVVYFQESMEELEIDASKIRTRQDWIKPVGQRAFVWQVHTPSMGDVEIACNKTAEVITIPDCNTPSRETEGSSSLLYKSGWESGDCWGTTKRSRKENRVVKRAPATRKSQQACCSRRPKKSLNAMEKTVKLFQPFHIGSMQSLQEQPSWPSPVNSTCHRACHHHTGMASSTDLSFPIPSPSTPGMWGEVKAAHPPPPPLCSQKLRWLQQKAYQGVLAAFHAQSDTLTFPQNLLLTDLRKMLNVGQHDSDELLKQVMDQIEDPFMSVTD